MRSEGLKPLGPEMGSYPLSLFCYASKGVTMTRRGGHGAPGKF